MGGCLRTIQLGKGHGAPRSELRFEASRVPSVIGVSRAPLNKTQGHKAKEHDERR
jgi:hypothetical protein